MDFYGLVGVMDQVGAYDILLPFILVFTLVFAVLQKINLFGTGKKNINAIVSLVIALFFLNNTYLIYVLQKFLPNVSIILIIFLMLLLLIGVFAGPTEFTNVSLGIAFFVSLIAIVIALFTDVFAPTPYGGFSGWYYAIDPGTRFMAWLLLFGVVFIMFVMKEPPTAGKGFGKFLEEVGKNIKSR